MSKINDNGETIESTFPINLKLINQYQRKEPSLMAKYKYGTYQNVYFRGVSYIDLNLITREDKIVIPSILQGYILHRYHTYLLHPGMDRTYAVVCQHFYWPDISDASVRK